MEIHLIDGRSQSASRRSHVKNGALKKKKKGKKKVDREEGGIRSVDDRWENHPVTVILKEKR